MWHGYAIGLTRDRLVAVAQLEVAPANMAKVLW
jgi:hypothetical protein